ncbi:tRNA pseudouridine(55) synthase TruB [bacterium]|nr:tRNA pseudouridine(55) synthase TruB [bacterium]
MPDGALIIDKPAGPTSFDIVARVRRLANVKRVGHAGTLDPFATGVLVVLIGKATRLSDFVTGGAKRYVARLSWGAATDTLDATGEVVETTNAPLPGDAAIREMLARFVGEIEQIPPMYSAKKIEGTRLYRHARKGREVEREPVRVRIAELSLISSDNAGFIFEALVGRGTYIRSLADDIARALGGLAHLAELRRTASGPFTLNRAITLDDLAGEIERDPGGRDTAIARHLVPLADLAPDLPAIALNDAAVSDVCVGKPVPFDDAPQGARTTSFVRLIDASGALVAIAAPNAGEQGFKPRRVFREPQG